METSDCHTRTVRGFAAVKCWRRLAGVSLGLAFLAPVLALDGAGAAAQASTSPDAPAAAATAYYFVGEVHPQGNSTFCLSSDGTTYHLIFDAKCGLHGQLQQWIGNAVCKKVGGKEVCVGNLDLLKSDGKGGPAPTFDSLGVHVKTAPLADLNDVILCPHDKPSTCLYQIISWIPEGTQGTADEIWVQPRNNANLLWDRDFKGAEDVELGKPNSHYGAVWTHPKWELAPNS